MTEDEFRVEVELADEGHGLSLGERLRALDLDDEARERLGARAVVTRDGSHLFVYSTSLDGAAEARRVIAELLAEDGLDGEVRTTRWHPLAGAWKDAADPLPDDEEARAAELRERPREDADDDERPEHPAFVVISSYKPQFIRDLGL